MRLTIAHFTNRTQPRWNWFIDSLRRQTTLEERKDIQLIFVDAHMWDPMMSAEEIAAARDVGSLFPHMYYSHTRFAQFVGEIGSARSEFGAISIVPPKPNVWQGPFRLTESQYFAASNARNTALIAAEGGFFVGVDDLSVLVDGWWPQVCHAMNHGYCVCGAYKKVKELKVEDGKIVSYTEFPPGIDSRWTRGSEDGIVPATGSWLFGCSFGLPLSLALGVNGFDEICDGQGAEDYDFGIRVERAGGKFFYNRNMLTLESEEEHYTDKPLLRHSKIVTPENLPAGYQGNPSSDHVLLHRVTTENRSETIGTPPLKALRTRFLDTFDLPIPTGPTHDWRDGSPLSQS